MEDKSPLMKELIYKWQIDSNGCYRIRNVELFNNILDSIKIKNVQTFIEFYGRPNRQYDTSNLSESYIIYEYYFNRPCVKGFKPTETSIIRVAFTSLDSNYFKHLVFEDW